MRDLSPPPATTPATAHHAESRLVAWLLGPHGRRRGHVKLTLLALAVYALFGAVVLLEVRVGLIAAAQGIALIAVGMAGIVTFYLLVRTGWSDRLSSDPSLTVPQILFGVAITAWGYAINPPLRGAVMAIMMLNLVWGMFVLTPRQSRLLAAWAFVSLASVMVWKGLTDPVDFPPQEESIRLLFFAILMGAMGVLAVEMGELRAKAKTRRIELEGALQRIQALAVTDELTGLANRRAIGERLMHEWHVHQRNGLPLSLALLDLDYFKSVNDQYGHSSGDRALSLFARAAQAPLRAQDALGRWGGEEFLLVLPNTPGPQAEVGLARLRAAVAAASFADAAPGLQVTFSAGIVTVAPNETVERALDRCDRALYRAKSQGRDRVEVD